MIYPEGIFCHYFRIVINNRNNVLLLPSRQFIYNMRIYCYFLLVLLMPGRLFSSTTDSIPPVKKIKTVIHFIYEKDVIYGNVPQYIVDTTVAEIDKVNSNLDYRYNYLGTNGSAAQPLIFRNCISLYTYTGVHSFDGQLLISDSLRYFNSNKRYTEVNYHNSSFKEQQISVIHSQNITKNWNAGLIFARRGVLDYMSFSSTYRSRFALFTNFNSANNKYKLFAHAIWNTIENGVNGGLENDSLFDFTNVSNLGIKGLAYRIANASQHARKKILHLSQYYDLGRTVTDSTGKVIGKKHIQILYRDHIIHPDKIIAVVPAVDKVGRRLTGLYIHTYFTKGICSGSRSCFYRIISFVKSFNDIFSLTK